MATTKSTAGFGYDVANPMAGSFVNPDDLRTSFTMAMSAMYRNEVPKYGDLVRIVAAVNKSVTASGNSSSQIGDTTSARLELERHGAIRLGTPYELRTMRRLFRVIGLEAVGYYDLSMAGLPMHATCFRPTNNSSLKKNPFRVFTTLLRPELLKDKVAEKIAMDLLQKRNIFSPKLLELIDLAESQNNLLDAEDAQYFIEEAMKTFSWRPVASATEIEYKSLAAEHPILADIASFQSSHINHLTPRTLDISTTQELMKVEGLNVKDRIEGPPPRTCPILLRQTSFLALEESIKFVNTSGELVTGTHRARFGEVEERGAAVTPAGRKLYDELLMKAMERFRQGSVSGTEKTLDEVTEDVFRKFQDSWSKLRVQGLVYFTYRKTAPAELPTDQSVEELIASGHIEATPITYEDFLPLSAAGIFRSNLSASSSQGEQAELKGSPDVDGFERALGAKIISSDELYLAAQTESLERCGLVDRE